MRVFVAGGTEVLGRRLVPRLVARCHQATATSAATLGLPARPGATAERELGWQLRYPSWQQGFKEELA